MIDLQSQSHKSIFDLKGVGVSRLSYPIKVRDVLSNKVQDVHGRFQMGVDVPGDLRGTHMSRFIQCLNRFAENEVMDSTTHLNFTKELFQVLEAQTARVRTEFNWFYETKAPVSGLAALQPADVVMNSDLDAPYPKQLMITVLTKALCPCSKAISRFGAHNQRSEITLHLESDGESQDLSIQGLIAMAEECASSPLYPILKREDEKHVTEQAYENPAFVEDIARNVARKLYDLPAVQRFHVHVENFESIHHHNCFAELTYTR